MRVLIDTNVLLRAVQRSHPASLVAVAALKNTRWRADEPCLTPQNIIEFWNVCTRPVDANGLGLTASAADFHVTGFEHIFTILPDSMQIFREWRMIVIQHNVTGVSARCTLGSSDERPCDQYDCDI